MPVRAIKFKAIVPRQPEQLAVARAIWSTHRVVNSAVEYYERKLLVLRGEGYRISDDEAIKAESVIEERAHLIRAARARNAPTSAPLTEVEEAEAARLLRQLYEDLVPAILGKRCSAQAAGGFAGPLMAPSSRGFLEIFDKLKNPPDWLDAVRDGEARGFEAAEAWLATERGQARMKATGPPLDWVRKVRAEDPGWPAAFVADFDKKLKEVEGTPSRVKRLKALAVLPIFEPYLAPRIEEARGATGPWDRLGLRLAVAHLCSWESWCRRCVDEHRERKQRIKRFEALHLTDALSPAIESLRRYELERTESQSALGLVMVRDFQITMRMLRSWPDLRERWLSASDRHPETLREIISREQARLRGRFGDPHLFRWLAEPTQHFLWAESDADPVSLVGRFNAMQSLLDRSRETALMTFPHPIEHPRSAQWEAQGGSNLRNHRLEVTGKRLKIAVRLLEPGDAGALKEREYLFELAPSGQFQFPEMELRGRSAIHASFRDGSGEHQSAKVGAADLLLDWRHLRNRRDAPERFEQGDIGPVYFKIAFDLEPKLPEGWNGKKPKALHYFRSACAVKPNKWAGEVSPGLRVLSVDLGIRTFGTCSVFELVEGDPGDGLAFPVDELRLWARHERSFHLRLPGEVLGDRALAWQASADAGVRTLRRAIGRYRALYRLADLPADLRRELLEGLQESLPEEATERERARLEGLIARVTEADELWGAAAVSALRDARNELGTAIGDWRRRTRGRDRFRGVGKTMWAIRYLSEVRRLLQSWSLLGHASGEIRRLDRERGGIFAAGLLEHLNHVKEDRLKTGADLIVQAARGYVRDDSGQWAQRYAPCELILFEDLSRYRMRTDRPRRENSDLMRWAHRAVPQEVAMQGELYGVSVIDTPADFSSRFSARTHAPGVRCHQVRRRDLEAPYFRTLLERENSGIDTSRLKPGDYVPLTGGEWFASLARKGVAIIHADVNAAQNLQRRFWMRHRDAYRLPCQRVVVNGESLWVPRSLGKRVRGALGGYGYLQPISEDNGAAEWSSLSAAAWRRYSGADASSEDEVSQSIELEELAGLEEEELERSAQFVTYFRDPSGLLLPAHRWYPAKIFWSVVKRKTAQRLR